MPFPRVVPHSDGMGVIDAVGAEVNPARVGQRVWVWNAAWGRPTGTAAGLVVRPQQQAVALPDNVPGEVSDEVFEALRQHFDTTQLVELTSAIATYNMVARFLVALGVSPEE